MSAGPPPRKTKANETPEIQFKPPLKPHKQLFITLAVVFAVWVIGLIILYCRTVYPMRHH